MLKLHGWLASDVQSPQDFLQLISIHSFSLRQCPKLAHSSHLSSSSWHPTINL